jgi:hypothetical protein
MPRYFSSASASFPGAAARRILRGQRWPVALPCDRAFLGAAVGERHAAVREISFGEASRTGRWRAARRGNGRVAASAVVANPIGGGIRPIPIPAQPWPQPQPPQRWPQPQPPQRWPQPPQWPPQYPPPQCPPQCPQAEALVGARAAVARVVNVARARIVLRVSIVISCSAASAFTQVRQTVHAGRSPKCLS